MTQSKSWVIQQINKRNILETTDDSTAYQQLWDVEKALLRGMLIAIRIFIKKLQRNQINDLTMHFRDLKNKNKPNQITGGRKKIERKINKSETKMISKRMKRCFSEKQNSYMNGTSKQKRKERRFRFSQLNMFKEILRWTMQK